jgi:apolipoprotein D and lipocalin family protein
MTGNWAPNTGRRTDDPSGAAWRINAVSETTMNLTIRMLACLIASTALAVGAIAAPAAQPLPQDSSIDLKKYLGLWYETARTPNENQDNRPRRDGKQFSSCFNTTAEYKMLDANSIELTNRCVREAPDGSTFTDIASGVAIVEEGSGGRKLKVAFGSGVARFFQRLISGGGFNYWIVCIGAENKTGLYDWAVVSGPARNYIFILTREKLVSEAVRKQILGCAAAERLPVERLIYRQR